MLLRGINYDIGTPFRKDELSRPDFNELIIRKEIEIIKVICIPLERQVLKMLMKLLN